MFPKTRRSTWVNAFLVNAAFWQRLLEFLDASVGDLGARERQIIEIGQPFQVHQTSVGDLEHGV